MEFHLKIDFVSHPVHAEILVNTYTRNDHLILKYQNFNYKHSSKKWTFQPFKFNLKFPGKDTNMNS